MAAKPEYQQFEPWEEALQAYPALFFAIVSVTITSTHCLKFYQDFFTTERRSVQHRRAKPVHDEQYKKGAYLTLITVLLYSLLIVSLAVQYNFTSGKCVPGVQVIGAFAVYAAKVGLYLTYVFRLHQVYGPSAYGYSPKKLCCVASVAVVLSVALCVGVIFGYFATPIIYDDTDGTFPWFCFVVIKPQPFGLIFGGGMVLFEIVASIMSIIGFTRPLKKVVAAMEQTMSTRDVMDAQMKEAQKRNQKILYSGYKYKVLVICASISTLIWIFLFVVELNSTATIVMMLDYVINPVCLLLMTPYYPSNIYYERLCYLCICCCDRADKDRYQSKATPPRTSVTGVKSLDTSRAVVPRDSVKSENVASQSPPDDAASDVALTVDLNTQTSAADAVETGVTPEPPQAQEEENADS